MRFTKDKSRCVYVGWCGGEVVYVGRGRLTRPADLISGVHHCQSDIDEVEIRGPYSIDEAYQQERTPIEEHRPSGNIQGVCRGARFPREGVLSDLTWNIVQDLKRGCWLKDLAIKHGTTIQNVSRIKQTFVPDYKRATPRPDSG